MALAFIPRSACRWTFDKTCEIATFVGLSVLAICLVVGPLEPGLVALLGRFLETRIPTSDPAQINTIGGIIVLGGSIKRVEAAVELAATLPNTMVVLSGPGDSEIRYASAHLGQRLIIDRRPASTYQNAVYAYERISASLPARWILVTSAIHMPRALGSFQALSLPVAPWLVYDTPSDHKSLSYSVRHEVIGLIAYRLLGMSDAFLPLLSIHKPLETDWTCLDSSYH